MKSSNIVLAVLAGAAIGGIIAIVLKVENALLADDEEEGNFETPRFKKIAQQFSDKISGELKAAEQKLKHSLKSEFEVLKTKEDNGVFL